MQLTPEQWRKWFGPLPGKREAHAISLLALGVAAIVCGCSLFLGVRGKTFLGRPLGGDFVEFYVIGKILNQHAAHRMYDLALAVGLQHATLPTMDSTQMLVFGHAPYIAFLFRPFAMLPYTWAYVAWLTFSGALYLLTLLLLFHSVGLPRADWNTGLLLSLSAVPFILETWIGGQLSVLGFFAWALFFYCRRVDRMFLAGIALSLALFKPTLVALPVVMMAIARLWRTLAGVMAGGSALALLSIKMAGLDGCRAWIHTLMFNARMVAGPTETSHLAKQVDLNSFFHLVFWNSHLPTAIAMILCGVPAFVILSITWLPLSTKRICRPSDLLWAATICFMLVVNSYSPIYDTILVAAPVALAASVMHTYSQRDRGTFSIWLLLIYLVPSLTQSFAQFLHVQLFTVVLAGFGAWLLKLEHGREDLFQSGMRDVGTMLAAR